MAIFESLRIKGVVTMPLTTRECPLDTMVADGTLPVLKEGRYDLRAGVDDSRATSIEAHADRLAGRSRHLTLAIEGQYIGIGALDQDRSSRL